MLFELPDGNALLAEVQRFVFEQAGEAIVVRRHALGEACGARREFLLGEVVLELLDAAKTPSVDRATGGGRSVVARSDQARVTNDRGGDLG